MNYVVEPAIPGDGPVIGTILSRWIDETPWMPRIHTVDQDIAHGGWLIEVCKVSVVRMAGQAAGFLAQQGATIQALYVAQQFRAQGIGSTLLVQAQRDDPSLNLWTFQANGDAQRFYLGHGFTEDRRSDGAGNDEHLPDIHMVWQRERR